MSLGAFRDSMIRWLMIVSGVILAVVSLMVAATMPIVVALPYGIASLVLAWADWVLIRDMLRKPADMRQPHADAVLFIALSGMAAATLAASLLSRSPRPTDAMTLLLAVVTGLFARSALHHARAGTVRPPRGWAITRSRGDIRSALETLRKSRER
jgi:hypothetical protein